jgi:hypothetical protein
MTIPVIDVKIVKIQILTDYNHGIQTDFWLGITMKSVTTQALHAVWPMRELLHSMYSYTEQPTWQVLERTKI